MGMAVKGMKGAFGNRKSLYLQLFTWAVFLCFQMFFEVTSKLTDSGNNGVGIISMKGKTNIFYDSITPDPLYSI